MRGRSATEGTKRHGSESETPRQRREDLNHYLLSQMNKEVRVRIKLSPRLLWYTFLTLLPFLCYYRKVYCPQLDCF